MGYCCLPPERVELTVNSKKETNGRVKMGQESYWTTMVYLRKSQTNSEQQEETNGRVEIGHESKWTKD